MSKPVLYTPVVDVWENGKKVRIELSTHITLQTAVKEREYYIKHNRSNCVACAG